MKLERIQLKLTSLPKWRASVKPGRQSIRRTVELSNHTDAMLFAGALAAVAEEHPMVPRIDVRPDGTSGQPTRVTVTITATELEDEHFTLARAVDATLVALLPEADDDSPAGTV